MKNIGLWLSATVLVVAALSGCAAKKDGDDRTNVGDLDENATYDSALADTGFRVTGGIAGTASALQAGANGSAASVKVVDLTPDDSAGALDKADFLIDAKEANGSRLQAELRSIVTAADVAATGEFFGGAAHNVDINGDSGVGSPDLPKTKAYLLLSGQARVRYNNQTLQDLHLVQVAVTKAIHAADGTLLTEADTQNLEFHVLFPGSLVTGNRVLPISDEGFAYFFFQNVKLTQLAESDKAAVGSKLTPPEKPNVLPIAHAEVKVAGAGATIGLFDPDKTFLNVTLDASNSTDEDGQIEAFSWDVKEVNATGVLVPLNRTSGQVANFSFTSAGLKQVDLRIIDEDGGISNTTIYFYVNYVKKFSAKFGSGGAAQSAGGGTSCMDAFNCFTHTMTIYYGAQELKITAPRQVSGTCNGGSVQVLDPKGAVAGSGSTVTIKAEKLTMVGKYQVKIYWSTQVTCGYEATATVAYAPLPAA